SGRMIAAAREEVTVSRRRRPAGNSQYKHKSSFNNFLLVNNSKNRGASRTALCFDRGAHCDRGGGRGTDGAASRWIGCWVIGGPIPRRVPPAAGHCPHHRPGNAAPSGFRTFISAPRAARHALS